MASGDRRMSFDRINSNNRQEGAQSNDEAPSNDDQPRPSDPLATLSERGQEAGSMRRIEQVISMFTLQRNSSRETARRGSFDRINSNNRVENEQPDDEVPLNDLESVSSYATAAETAVSSDEDSHRRHAGPSPAGSSIDESVVSASTLMVRRGSNPGNILLTGGRFQPGDEPEAREEAPLPIDRPLRHTKVRFDAQPSYRTRSRSPSPPYHSPRLIRWIRESAYANYILAILFVAIIALTVFVTWWGYTHTAWIDGLP